MWVGRWVGGWVGAQAQLNVYIVCALGRDMKLNTSVCLSNKVYLVPFEVLCPCTWVSSTCD